MSLLIDNLSVSVRTIIAHLENGITKLHEPARSQFEKALATTKQEPLLGHFPWRWSNAKCEDPGPFSEDSIKSVQLYLERAGKGIKDEVRDLMKLGEIINALKCNCIPELEKAVFPRDPGT